jgi:3-hydroxybutyrate dehydrogenase
LRVAVKSIDMADMSVEEAMEKYGPSEITRDEILVVEDPAYNADNVAIVTGAANGIGRATALCLAGNGLTVVGTDMDEAGLAEVRERATELDLPGSVETVAGNLTDDADMERIVEFAAEQGNVRYLANIAGLQTIAPIAEFPMEKYDLMHDVMQRAPLVLSKLCWPHFEANDDGVGVVGNMCSIHGHIVTKEKVAYNMVKFGLRGLTQSIAAEGEGEVRAFSVSTAYVKTPLVAKQLPDSADSRGLTVDEVVNDVMLGPTRVKELMEPYEVGNLFVMGFSKHSSHLNGGDMHHEGGMSLTYE